AGGFDGNFLNSAGLDDLRHALLESAVTSVGPAVKQVLIVDLVKQEI
ncbi:MAG: flagellar basal body-associated protein FliL, partial [Mangrovicoccus sp.]|nr:flagellar basal body-associated protein FliL [Mangrovicoccus sp.]